MERESNGKEKKREKEGIKGLFMCFETIAWSWLLFLFLLKRIKKSDEGGAEWVQQGESEINHKQYKEQSSVEVNRND